MNSRIRQFRSDTPPNAHRLNKTPLLPSHGNFSGSLWLQVGIVGMINQVARSIHLLGYEGVEKKYLSLGHFWNHGRKVTQCSSQSRIRIAAAHPAETSSGIETPQTS